MSAGNILLIRLSQKFLKLNLPNLCSFSIIEVIRKPEITKKTSTPTKPPGRDSGEK